jgi:hypothetical protein
LCTLRKKKIFACWSNPCCRLCVILAQLWLRFPGTFSSRIHRSLTGGKGQLRHRDVVPARQATWLAGRYDNPMPEWTLSPSQGSLSLAQVERPRTLCQVTNYPSKMYRLSFIIPYYYRSTNPGIYRVADCACLD